MDKTSELCCEFHSHHQDGDGGSVSFSDGGGTDDDDLPNDYTMHMQLTTDYVIT